MKPAIIIGHPGHELRVLKFIEIFKPLVFVLTDGSGGNGESRIASTKRVVENLGCECSGVFGYFSDDEMYRSILNKDISAFVELREKISGELLDRNIDFIFGDACEGFSPTHDLCRYIINRCIQENRKIKNYDFLLNNFPCASSNDFSNITLKLSDEDKIRRDELIMDYPEIQQEIKNAKERFPIDVFNYECIREVKNYKYNNWKDEKPFYETYGLKKIQEGKYKEVITFKHISEIAENI